MSDKTIFSTFILSFFVSLSLVIFGHTTATAQTMTQEAMEAFEADRGKYQEQNKAYEEEMARKEAEANKRREERAKAREKEMENQGQ